jgi:hypothetical protein
MLNHQLHHDDGILVLSPEGPLEASDFTLLARQVDHYLEHHSKLRGVLIRVQSFPGWEDFDALIAHVKFLKDHLSKIEKVAVVAGGAMATIVPPVANYFVHAEVKRFSPEVEYAAWAWLHQPDATRMPPAGELNGSRMPDRSFRTSGRS